ncbi:permease/efflux membrane protein, putative [Psychroflexus gondwanensis ACAM 44]|uniref:Permease/efflux membrane protein, putative n=1 Tax=Psychroflexus gondwanensis ACAM 44 TaxID=1189619 RepID=N1X1E9_9FLAO|nr:MFS transporter [Psychroflexus gondwanensis]EMY81878.1 permease/efflux membrane protein, putative [Psychroflexus gondwanensis ACAM 44]
MGQKTLPKGHKKLINAWAFYDWANSVYPLVISSAIFPIYYGALTILKDDEGLVISDTVNFLGFDFNNDALISYVTALAFVVISIISPLLGGISDYIGNKKNFMKFFNYLGAISCIGLFWFSLENLWFGLLCYFFGLIGFWGSIVFYNSYLPDIAQKDQQDRASAKGYTLGYMGSVILLVCCLILILFHSSFGFVSESLPTRISFILTGVWWIAFSQYTYAYLPKGNRKGKIKTKDLLLNGFRELKTTYSKIKTSYAVEPYLKAFFVYSMAVQTIMLIATYFGVGEIQWPKGESTTGLIVSILLIQLVAIVGANAASRLAESYGNINLLIWINTIWIGICVYAFFITQPMQFYITAFFVGLVMGAIQSLSRSTFSKYIPDDEKDTASFFSFYEVTEKVGIVIGMFLYGFIAQITGSIRNAILFLILFFIGGIFLLFRLKAQTKKG